MGGKYDGHFVMGREDKVSTGTAWNRAPEVGSWYRDQDGHTQSLVHPTYDQESIFDPRKVDIYALGMVFCQLLLHDRFTLSEQSVAQGYLNEFHEADNALRMKAGTFSSSLSSVSLFEKGFWAIDNSAAVFARMEKARANFIEFFTSAPKSKVTDDEKKLIAG